MYLSTSSCDQSPSRLPVSSMYVRYVINDICEGTCETIGDLKRSLRSRYLASVNNEKTSFAS